LCDYQHFGGSKCDLPIRWTAKHSIFYRQDFEFIPKLGLRAFRTGIEWARIEPKENSIDKEAVKFYHEYFRALRRTGVKTFVTLHHFTNPAWIHDHEGWLSNKVVEKFGKYVDFVSSEFGKYIDYYVVFNEPSIYAYFSHFSGELPPFHKDMAEAVSCLNNIIDASANACDIIHKNNPKAKVGFSNYTATYVPYDPSDPENVQMCEAAKAFMTYQAADALKDKVDYVGLDYYTKIYVTKDGTTVKAEIYPEGIRYYLKDFFERYRKPVAVIENGYPSRDDERKIKFMLDHLMQIHDVINKDKVNVLAYLWWSFLHGYEWGYEYVPFFALIDVDIDKTYKRKKTEAFEVYKQVCKQNGFHLSLHEKYRSYMSRYA